MRRRVSCHCEEGIRTAESARINKIRNAGTARSPAYQGGTYSWELQGGDVHFLPPPPRNSRRDRVPHSLDYRMNECSAQRLIAAVSSSDLVEKSARAPHTVSFSKKQSRKGYHSPLLNFCRVGFVSLRLLPEKDRQAQKGQPYRDLTPTDLGARPTCVFRIRRRQRRARANATAKARSRDDFDQERREVELRGASRHLNEKRKSSALWRRPRLQPDAHQFLESGDRR